MKISKLLQGIKIITKNFKNDFDIKNLSHNSKSNNYHGLYFCIEGINFDGHDFAAESINNGTICLVVTRLLPLDIPQIVVKDVRIAMAIIAKRFNKIDFRKIKLIGITGTNGKTTTTNIIFNILNKSGINAGLIGTEGYAYKNIRLSTSLTTPDSLDFYKILNQMQQNNIKYVAMEVSAHAIYYNKLYNAKFYFTGLTNITQDHLDFFKNMENYISCKSSFFLNNKTYNKIINIDDSNSNIVFKNIKDNKNSISVIDTKADIYGQIIERNIASTVFKLHTDNKIYDIKTNLIGDFNINNLLMAIGACKNIIPTDQIVKIINTYNIKVIGRLNLFTDYKGTHIYVDYAHTPDGLKNIISLFTQYKNHRIITVFGCGGDRDKTKRSIMGQIATGLSDYVYITSDNPRYEDPQKIINMIVGGINKNNYEQIIDREQAIRKAIKNASITDIVLICGKGAENYMDIAGKKIHYSDLELVKKIVEEHK